MLPLSAKSKLEELVALAGGTTLDKFKRIKSLLAKGTDPNGLSETGVSPLMAAIGNGDLDVIRLLIKHGADPESTIDIVYPLNIVYPRGKKELTYSALMRACAELRQLEVIDLLVSAGADPDREIQGWTALMYAAKSGSSKHIRRLTQKGANVDFQAASGKTALMIAASCGRARGVETIVQLGANRMLVDEDGLSAADHALNAKRYALEPKRKALAGFLASGDQELPPDVKGPEIDRVLCPSCSVYTTREIAEKTRGECLYCFGYYNR